MLALPITYYAQDYPYSINGCHDIGIFQRYNTFDVYYEVMSTTYVEYVGCCQKELCKHAIYPVLVALRVVPAPEYRDTADVISAALKEYWNQKGQVIYLVDSCQLYGLRCAYKVCSAESEMRTVMLDIAGKVFGTWLCNLSIPVNVPRDLDDFLGRLDEELTKYDANRKLHDIVRLSTV